MLVSCMFKGDLVSICPSHKHATHLIFKLRSSVEIIEVFDGFINADMLTISSLCLMLDHQFKYSVASYDVHCSCETPSDTYSIRSLWIKLACSTCNHLQSSVAKSSESEQLAFYILEILGQQVGRKKKQIKLTAKTQTPVS